jgi:F420-dependent oxidoreductase-like protein
VTYRAELSDRVLRQLGDFPAKAFDALIAVMAAVVEYPDDPMRTLPTSDPHVRRVEFGGTGLGKPLRSILHPYRKEIPIYLGAEGPKNVALAAEIADGWNTIFFSPSMNGFYAAALGEGFARPGARHTAETFDVVGGPMRIIVDDDIERAADLLRPSLALYIGGMGARGVNYHHEVFARMGYEGQAAVIQDHYLAGDKRAAIAAVPTAMVEDVALIGPWAKIADEIQRWQQTVITTFSVSTDLRHLERVVGLLRR